MTQETIIESRTLCNSSCNDGVDSREDSGGCCTQSTRSPSTIFTPPSSASSSTSPPISLPPSSPASSVTTTIRTSGDSGEGGDSSTSTRDTSFSEMLAKVPVTESRGSLMSSVTKLLRVLDISETHIMIPALLKDKCEFDAYEMLTLAKILKASILGHNDLVEYYMSESSSQYNYSTSQQAANKRQANELMTTNITPETTTTTTTTTITTTSTSTSTIPSPVSASELTSSSSATSSEARSSPHSRSSSASSSASSTSSLVQPTISNSLETPSSTFSSSRGSSSSASSSLTHDVSDPNYDLTTSDNLSINGDNIISNSTIPATVAAAMLPGHDHHNHHHLRIDRMHCRQHRNSRRGPNSTKSDKPIKAVVSNCDKTIINYATNNSVHTGLPSHRVRESVPLISSSSTPTRGSTSLQIDSQTSPEVTFRLLLHIEQLKTFIPQVTNLFESITELYMNSIEGINL